MFKLILITVVLLGVGFAGIAIKIWAKKDGEFAGTCSSQNPRLKAEGIGCACGGSGTCENESNHTHNPERQNEYFETPPTIIVKKVG